MASKTIELHHDQIFYPEFKLDDADDIQAFTRQCRLAQGNANRLYYRNTEFVFTLSKDPHLTYFFRALKIFFTTIGHRNARRVRNVIVDVKNTDWDTLTEEAITRLWRMQEQNLNFYITLRIGGGCPYLRDAGYPVEGVAFGLFDWEETLTVALAAIEQRKENIGIDWYRVAGPVRTILHVHHVIDILRKVENAPERLAQ